MTVEAKKAARSQQKAEERPTLSRCFADHQSGKVKAVRLTAKSNGVCGPGPTARHHATPLSPVINAEDWPQSHRRRTRQRQERSRELTGNCTDLLRPVHKTQRAITAQASEQQTGTYANPLRASMAHRCVKATNASRCDISDLDIVRPSSHAVPPDHHTGFSRPAASVFTIS